MITKDQIIGALPKLTSAELMEVENAIKGVKALGGASDDPAPVSDWLLSGIAAYLVSQGVLRDRGAIWDLRKRTSYKTYLNKLAGTTFFLVKLQDQTGIGTRARPQFSYLVSQALADWLRRRGLFSVSQMLVHIDKIPEALDEAYPGYAKAGLFRFITRPRRKELAE